jgi:hypothetical protein
MQSAAVQVNLRAVEQFIRVVGEKEDAIFQRRMRMLQRDKRRREQDKVGSSAACLALDIAHRLESLYSHFLPSAHWSCVHSQDESELLAWPCTDERCVAGVSEQRDAASLLLAQMHAAYLLAAVYGAHAARPDAIIPLPKTPILAGKPRAWERQGKGPWKVDGCDSQRRLPGVSAACARSGPRQPKWPAATCHPGTHCSFAGANDPR